MFEQQNLVDYEAAVLRHTLWTSASGSRPTRSPGREKSWGCRGKKILHLGLVMGHNVALTEPTSTEKSVSQGSIQEINGEPPQQQLYKAGVAVGSPATSPATCCGVQPTLSQHSLLNSLLRQNHLTQKLLMSFYHCSRKSVLTYCTYAYVWHASCTVADRRALKGVVTTAKKIIGCPLLSLDELYSSCCLQMATTLSKTHPTQDIICFINCLLTASFWQKIQGN